MASGGEEKNRDFYAVLGLNKECTAQELKDAYRKLALRWHPDRCSASASSKSVEESKKKFQAVQQAYSVLSDEGKRFLYDVGVYDSDGDDNDMGEFLSEMADMMSQTKCGENGEESLEELQELFDEMFQEDIDAYSSSSFTVSSSSSSTASPSYMSYCATSNSSNKRNSLDINGSKAHASSTFDLPFDKFCYGVNQCRGVTIGEETEGEIIPATNVGRWRRRRIEEEFSWNPSGASKGCSIISA